MKLDKIFLVLLGAVYVSITVVFTAFPRSTYSELEKRELATFPEFSTDKLLNGQFTAEVSSWFSDSEPYRDVLMTLSMMQKDALALRVGNDEDEVTFHASAEVPAEKTPGKSTTSDEDLPFQDTGLANENAKIANKGIIIVGKGEKARALMAYGGSGKSGTPYAEAANSYARALGSGVKVYCMVIPTAAAYYCPDKAKKCTNDQWPTIANIHAHLTDGAQAVDVYHTLGQHAAEDIYLRTDHHWAPLGAFYAAQKFAQTAGVPFKPLTNYDRRVVHKIVGSMYGYSKDIAIKNAPEDFVYYVPKGLNYTTWYTDYTVNANFQVTSERKPYKSAFFMHFPDGHGSAYCTFMGSDMRLTKVVTGTTSPRRLLIIKDSFGNALPGFLFYSFGEIHVVDFRYFTRNIVQYIHENKITDVLFACNIFNVNASSVSNKMKHFLKQQNGHYAPRTPADSIVRKDTTHHHTPKVNTATGTSAGTNTTAEKGTATPPEKTSKTSTESIAEPREGSVKSDKKTVKPKDGVAQTASSTTTP